MRVLFHQSGDSLINLLLLLKGEIYMYVTWPPTSQLCMIPTVNVTSRNEVVHSKNQILIQAIFTT